MWVKRENEARFLHQNEANFERQRNKMAANLDLFRIHLHWQRNANKIRPQKSQLGFNITDVLGRLVFSSVRA